MTGAGGIDIKKHITILSICILSLLLTACGGQKVREKDIPTAEDALAVVESEMGIAGAVVLDMQDARGAGPDYDGIESVYLMTSDRGLEFALLRCCEYDSLFGTGYFYSWITDYSDIVIRDYLRNHPLPVGIDYSDGSYSGYNTGVRHLFGEYDREIRFDFTSDAEFEDCLDDLEPWLEKWLSFERQFMVSGKDPQIRVSAYRAQDDTMNYSIQVSRTFGYDKDSFHVFGEDGSTYKWSSFREAMTAEYESQKKLKMK